MTKRTERKEDLTLERTRSRDDSNNYRSYLTTDYWRPTYLLIGLLSPFSFTLKDVLNLSILSPLHDVTFALSSLQLNRLIHFVLVSSFLIFTLYFLLGDFKRLSMFISSSKISSYIRRRLKSLITLKEVKWNLRHLFRNPFENRKDVL